MTELYMLYHKYHDTDPNKGCFTNTFIEDFHGIYSSINIIFDKIMKIKTKSNIFYFYIGTCEIDKEIDIQYSNDYDYKERNDYYKCNDAIFDDNDNFIFGNYTDEQKNIEYELVDVLNKIKSSFLIYNKEYKTLFDRLANKYELNNDSRFDIIYYKKSVNLRYVRKYDLSTAKKILNCCKEFYESNIDEKN